MCLREVGIYLRHVKCTQASNKSHATHRRDARRPATPTGTQRHSDMALGLLVTVLYDQHQYCLALEIL